MFFGCRSLTYVNLGNITPRFSHSHQEMFYNCPKLTYIDLSSFQAKDFQTMFNQLPPNGTILIKSNFLNLMKEEIPKDWLIKIID